MNKTPIDFLLQERDRQDVEMTNIWQEVRRLNERVSELEKKNKSGNTELHHGPRPADISPGGLANSGSGDIEHREGDSA